MDFPERGNQCGLATRNGVIFPVAQLAQAPLSYPPTGSHFNALGAYRAALSLLDHWQLEHPPP